MLIGYTADRQSNIKQSGTREFGNLALFRHWLRAQLHKSASQELAHHFSFYLPLSTHTATHDYLPKTRTSIKQPQDLAFRRLRIIYTAFQIIPCYSHVVKTDWHTDQFTRKFTGEHLLWVIYDNPFQPTLMTVTENKSYLFHASLLKSFSHTLELTTGIWDLFQVKH